MKRLSMGLMALAMTVLLATGAFAADIWLADDGYAFHINGTTFDQYVNPLPAPGLNTSLFDFVTGLGQVTYVQTGGGASKVVSFFDIEITGLNNTFFNEYGAVGNPLGLAVGQSWEIDEPGYVYGDIFTNVTNGTLDNSNGVPITDPDDVSMALGWNFNLAANQTATVTFVTADYAPAGGFYLQQVDPEGSIYYWSSLNIVTKPIGVPEPVTMLLLGLSIIGAAGLKRKL